MSRSLLTAVSFVVLLAPIARADDIKLKSGEVLTNVNVLKKTDTYWRVKLLDGKVQRIDPTEVVEHIEKATAGDIFDERADKLGKKDVAGMMELVRWGLEQGADVHAAKLLGKVIKIEEDHAEARKLLGHEMCDDGKWRYGRQLEVYQDKKLAVEREAMGWEKVKGTWLPPYEARRAKAGFVQDDNGVWRTKDEVSNLKKGLVWVEGNWYDAKEKAELDRGMRKDGGKWVDINDLNKTHKADDNPWVIPSEHFVVVGNQNHKTLSDLLAALEANWESMRDVFGDAPVTNDLEDKLRIIVHKDGEAYSAVARGSNLDNRASFLSSSLGGYYDPSTKVGHIYYFNPEYLAQWGRHVATISFLNKLSSWLQLKSNALEAWCSYFEGLNGGQYDPPVCWSNGLPDDALKAPLSELGDFTLDPRGKNSAEIESGFARLGLATHFLMSRHPETMKKWARAFVKSGANLGELRELLQAGGAQLPDDAALNAFRATFNQEWLERKRQRSQRNG